MTFLNFALAIGSAACVIPIVIHLLNRRRHEVLRWGAMHLLAPVVKTRRKRIKLEQLLLLLTRMAILALLALCMAGPVLTGWHALSGNAKSSLALLMDNSYSMDGGADAATNLEVAKRNATKLIEHIPRGSDVSVALMAGGEITGSQSPSTHREQISKDVEALPAGFGAANISESFESAVGALGKMQHAKRDIIVMSDFQSKDWSGENAASMQQVRQWIDAMPIRPHLTLIPVGSEITDNVSIESLDLAPSVVAVGQEVTIRVNVRNHSDVPFPNINVHLKIDGNDQLSDKIDLGPQETGQLVLRHQFDQPGSRVIETVAEADSLLADNSYIAVVPVWQRLPVLLVDGDPSDTPLKSETSFLQLALSPFMAFSSGAGARDDALPGADLLETTTIEIADLNQQRLEKNRVLVLANVARMSDRQLEAVKQFVKRGNSLLIFPGDRIDANWYENKVAGSLSSVTFGNLRSRRLGPVAAREPVIRPVAFRPGEPSDTEGVGIATEHYQHPVFEMFNDKKNGLLSEASFQSWFAIEQAQPKVIGGQEANARAIGPLARLTSGDPLFVEDAYGEGRVMTCATSCDDSWSNLPARPFYLPLMQRLVTYLATAVEPSRNLSVGQTLVANIPDDATTVSVASPRGEHIEFQAEDFKERGFIEFADTAQPGIYTVSTASHPEMHYAVVAPRDESSIERLTDEEVGEIAKSLGGSMAQSTEEYIEQDSTRRYGREIWRPLYWLMLCLVVGEIFLQQWFSGLKFSRA